ncbi:MAG: hypothetical protein ACYS8Z_11150 [Planctomycetota bacterium]
MGKVLENLITLLAEVIVPRNLAGNEDFRQIAPIELPPYGPSPIGRNTPCMLGRPANTGEWFVTTPAAALISDGKVGSSLEAQAPDLEAILRNPEGGDKVAGNISYQQIIHMTRCII